MSFSIVNILRLLRQHPVVVWLLLFGYALGAGYATVHTHHAHHDAPDSFHKALNHYVQSLELDDPGHPWDNDAHDCTACKFQCSHPTSDSARYVAILKAGTAFTVPAVRYFSRTTPTKRLTRAPPVA
ncbi:hypothetical protein [Endozoicomonas montiporae]|nr:hypothetical protein [Endozoicomonas montiporae]AMO55191.1 hypothetical protein EZMO1_0977 [Endozoicomonas montiporae CL-33]